MKKMTFFILMTFLILTNCQIVPNTLSHETMQSLIDEIRVQMFSPDSRNSLSVAKQLRAMFHDCSMGCDGSINTADPENRGLEGYVSAIDRAYRNTPLFRNTLSKADFVVLCGTVALGQALFDGVANSGSAPSLPQGFTVFQYGRPNNTLPANEDNLQGPFPSGLGNWENVLGTTKMALKNRITEYDLVALLGVHNLGRATQTNSGFHGNWGAGSDRNRLTNGMYTFMLGRGRRNFDLVQTLASEQNNGNPAVTPNHLQWTQLRRNGSSGTGRFLLNADLAIYHNFTTNANGSIVGDLQYCSQANNASLTDCNSNPNDPNSYMPLARNAQQAWTYTQNPTLFYQDFINAFLKMVSVPPENDPGNYQNYSPAWVCVEQNDGSFALECLGDVFRLGCPGFSQPACPPA